MIRKDRLKIKGERIYLRLLHPRDASRDYLNWLRDPLINKFLECRRERYSLKKIKVFIEKVRKSNNDFLFGVFLNNNGEHIGNVKIGNINPFHRFADLGILIGKKELWGKGYGKEAIRLATQLAFNKLNLHKLVAGIYANNKSSYKAFLKCGYIVVGRLKKDRHFNKRYVDNIIVEKINK